MTNRSTPPGRYLEALGAVALVAGVTAATLPLLGLASAALLFLLPVLLAAVRGGVGPGLVAALAGAAAYNFFLLPPRFTFRIHDIDNLVSAFVLVAVALVTSRLATRLTAREAEARDQARRNGEAADLAEVLSSEPADTALARGLAAIAARHGETVLIAEGLAFEGPSVPLAPLDASAAAWAIHNGDRTGHGTTVMPDAGWSFVPLAPKAPGGGPVLGIARPAAHLIRSGELLDHLARLAALIGQRRDRDRLETERRVRERLEESDHLRRTFLASLAHDFRTPLTVITGRLALLAHGNPDAGEALSMAQRLDRTMNDLLAAARIEAGSLAPKIETLDLVDAVESARAALDESTIAIATAIPADLPFIAADPVLLQQVLVNLIDNALRHARTAVRITAATDGDAVTLSVGDDGPGIPAADRERVFDRFARIEGSDRASGSGLGLAIVRGFAEAMGMTVGIEDAEAGGACFTLRMPQAAGTA